MSSYSFSGSGQDTASLGPLLRVSPACSQDGSQGFGLIRGSSGERCGSSFLRFTEFIFCGSRTMRSLSCWLSAGGCSWLLEATFLHSPPHRPLTTWQVLLQSCQRRLSVLGASDLMGSLSPLLSGRLLVSTSLSCSSGVLFCSFIWNVFLCPLILSVFLCLWSPFCRLQDCSSSCFWCLTSSRCGFFFVFGCRISFLVGSSLFCQWLFSS